MSDLQQKYTSLLQSVQTLEKVMVAFSGGVDSTFLVAAVKESGMPYLAVTAVSPTMPAQDLADVKTAISAMQISHRFIESGELNDDDFVKNSSDRCFFCKSDLFKRLTDIAQAEGFAAVFDGSTTDDLVDYRPGTKAKNQFQVRSPIQEAGLSKEEIRQLSREMGLKTWDKPASPCLSSRISYGEPILTTSLTMVENAEIALKNMGFGPLRVRKQGETARIELTDMDINLILAPETRKKVTREVLSAGFKFVALDLEGFQSGKLNRVIPIEKISKSTQDSSAISSRR
jgi:pyridinium-3,5-biscarboxylic acid mononucleotide sulfurtransferase